MKKKYLARLISFLLLTFVIFSIISCKKDNKSTTNTPQPVKIGLYEVADSFIYKQLQIPIVSVGTDSVDYDLLFDTGSGGMVLDADGLLPSSMITSNGFSFNGDTTVVNGITITNQTTTVSYGEGQYSATAYGNLAYAPITVGDENGKAVIKRVPFFLYYKATDVNGNKYSAHTFDVFGSNEGYDISFQDGTNITSPFAYFQPATGLTRGYKMAAIGSTSVNIGYNFYQYLPAAITLGLTTNDLSASSGFIFSQLTMNPGNSSGYYPGYFPMIRASVNYTSQSYSSFVLFDSGTNVANFLEDPTYQGNKTIKLGTGSQVSIQTVSGFNYSYTNNSNLIPTFAENPSFSGGLASVISIDFFTNNEYLLDFDDHKLGLKSN